MKATLKFILATTTAYLSMSAFAADSAVTTAPAASGLTSEQARDLKTESKAEYKARKKVVDAKKELDVADCKTSGLESRDERECKHDAKTSAKEAKRDAKQIYKDEKDSIKAHKE